ncbi:uncharacterized protein KD926_004635 [Aspergillus affinis]|uniref:uncharacterized protein n=1 Tax=Aspergillus affinis TaxID=1070780 RepID=UPI0022FDD67D|nr:uncharacterized protein KD926_004635 [Aspergillus affinis]KAI9035089.1 hypothetical protein KD926_004635 [Aspergillus affinis]
MVEKHRHHQPLRVLIIIISHKNAHWEQSMSAPEEILLPLAYRVLQESHLIQDPPSNRNSNCNQPRPKMTLLAKRRWQTHIFLVLDISNPAYDPVTGHLPEHNNLPVAFVRLGQETVHAYAANRPAQNKVNQDVARAHNDNGIGNFPPFVTDYTSGSPLYTNPRDPSLLDWLGWA